MSDLQCASRIILTRHGEAEYESAAWADEGGSLTTLGRKQSADLAVRLANRRIARVWTSTLARAVQTGEIVAATLRVGVTTRSGLREFGCGDFRGTPLTEDPFADTFGRWLVGELDVRIPGAESGTELVARMRAQLQEISDVHRGETVLVVGHGGALTMALRALVSLGGIEPRRLANCDTVEIDIDGDGWVCRAWGHAPES